MNPKYLSLLLVLSLVGCAQLETQVAPRAAKAINSYCKEPQSNRLALRTQVNSLITPNSVQINCADDKVVGGQP